MSPGLHSLYRKGRRAVILVAFVLVAAGVAPTQSSGTPSTPKGPRALGLVELRANGKARLIPVTILYDGQFYDASAYKAMPVPMALESGIVYEGLRTGVSQGLFTVTGALRTKNSFIGEGTWQSAAELAAGAAASAKRREALNKPAPEPAEGPPVLRRGAEKAKPAASQESKPPTANPPSPPPPAATVSPPVAAEDTDRPMLRRGVPSPAVKEQRGAETAPARPASAKAGGAVPVQIIAAISDAGGPEPRPYAYSLKPDEEQKLRQKMLALAAGEVRSRAAQLEGGPGPQARTSAKAGSKAQAQPVFEDIELHAFDLSNSNEPIVVLMVKAHMPPGAGVTAPGLQYILTVVAREDAYGDLHKDLVNTTDTRHLDALPRLELIDAVDADGDGRGELLFRQVSDAGSAFVLYRVIGDQLWPLFQGVPGD